MLLATARPIAALVAVYLVIDLVVRRITDLGEDGYSQPSMIVELSRQTAFLVPILLVLGAWILWRKGLLGVSWPEIEGLWSLRLPVGAAIFLLTWWFGAYEYNLFLDQGHWADRGVLLLLAGLALWRPVFIAPWLLVLATMINQFYYPIGGYSIAESYQVVRVVELFLALLVIRVFIGRWWITEFVVVLSCLIVAGFFGSGIGKVRLGWLQAGAHMEENLLSTYSNGWLGTMGADSVSSLGRFVKAFAWPMFLGTAVLELGAVFAFWGRRTLIAFLGLFIVFHLGVVALTGIFFWRWMILELAMIVFLVGGRFLKPMPGVYTIIGFALILTGPIWAQSTALSWVESPVNYVYRFEATDAAGQSGQLPPAFFKPYDFHFTLSGFGYLSSDPHLPIVWGATRDRGLAKALRDADSTAEIFEIESRRGDLLFDQDRAADMDRFISVFLSNWNREKDSGVLSVLDAPPQLLTFGHDAYAGAGPIESVRVVKVTTYWDGEHYREIDNTTVRTIDVPTEPAGSASTAPEP